MKKVFLILILFLSCYIIYNNISGNKMYYLTIGDFLSKGTTNMVYHHMDTATSSKIIYIKQETKRI